MLLSWSQTYVGHCHINPRPWGDVACAFELLGYELDRSMTRHIRHYTRMSWLKNNVMVLRKMEVQAAAPAKS